MSNKAARERRFRKREQQRKRFNMPLHSFLENKYPGVLQEYRELFETLNRNHPYTRNLAKTRTFKRWLESINRQPVTDILSTLVKETFGSSAEENETNIDQNVDQTNEATGQASEEDETDIDQNADQTSEAAGQAVGEDEIDIDEDDQTNEPAGQAVQEQLYKVVETTCQSAPEDEANEAAAVLVTMDDLANIMASVEDQVDDIVNELMQEQVIRDMITEPEDEEIEINPLDDIAFDLEPFDFNLEVENYDR